MEAVFDEQGAIQRWLDVEAALARAEAKAGIIPPSAADRITAACSLEHLDLDLLQRETALVGYPIHPLVRQLATLAGDPEGGYVHWGATTQDIMDTGLALQLRDARLLLEAELGKVREQLTELATQHRSTVMAGRTHGQQALPVTLGFKFAVYIEELRRHQQRLAQARFRTELVQFAGAAGTLASVGEVGLEVQRLLAAELGMGVPAITWHTSRDGVAEFGAILGMISATLAKLAQEVALLQRTEIAELSEGYEAGRGASSTMPHKRNPITSEAIIGANRIVRALAPALLDAMLHDGERATGPWHTEWLALSDVSVIAHGVVEMAGELLTGLVVSPVRMRSNLNLTNGLLNAEAVMMALAPTLGRQRAHEMVYGACMRAVDSGRTLREELLEEPDLIAAGVSEVDLDALLDPTEYVGLAARFVDEVVQAPPLRPTESRRGQTAGEGELW